MLEVKNLYTGYDKKEIIENIILIKVYGMDIKDFMVNILQKWS